MKQSFQTAIKSILPITPLFAVSRMAGWCAHRFEEINSGKRIIPPVYKSINKEKQYIELEMG